MKIRKIQEASLANLQPHLGKGRQKGVPNKVTKNFREAVNTLLVNNVDNFQKWINQTAEGDEVIGLKPDPYKALSILATLAEFAAPKLSRVDHTSGDAPLQLAPIIMPALAKED